MGTDGKLKRYIHKHVDYMWMVERDETVTRDKTRGAEVLARVAAREEFTEVKEGNQTKQGVNNKTQRKSVPERLEKTESGHWSRIKRQHLEGNGGRRWKSGRWHTLLT